jgi:hypothetical protein
MARDMVAELDGPRTGRVAAGADGQPARRQVLQAIDEQPKIRLFHSHRVSVRSRDEPARPENGVCSIGPLAGRD